MINSTTMKAVADKTNAPKKEAQIERALKKINNAASRGNYTVHLHLSDLFLWPADELVDYFRGRGFGLELNQQVSVLRVFWDGCKHHD